MSWKKDVEKLEDAVRECSSYCRRITSVYVSSTTKKTLDRLVELKAELSPYFSVEERWRGQELRTVSRGLWAVEKMEQEFEDAVLSFYRSTEEQFDCMSELIGKTRSPSEALSLVSRIEELCDVYITTREHLLGPEKAVRVGASQKILSAKELIARFREAGSELKKAYGLENSGLSVDTKILLRNFSETTEKYSCLGSITKKILMLYSIEAEKAAERGRGRTTGNAGSHKERRPEEDIYRALEKKALSFGSRDVLVEFSPSMIYEQRQEAAQKIASYFRTSFHAYKHLPYAAIKCAPGEAARISRAISNRIYRQENIPHVASGVYQSGVASVVCIPEIFFDVSPINPRRAERHLGSFWNHVNIGSDQANSITKGEKSLIAICDTGVDYTHNELRERFGEDKGYDFVDDTKNPMDENDHGTHVAGIVAGSSTGVAPSCSLLALRVLDGDGYGTMEAVIRAIDYSIDRNKSSKNKIVAINMSLGSPMSSPIERDACIRLYENGIALIAAAGNEGYGPSYPASYKNVIAVAAVDRNNEHADFSNIWHTNDISAPGVDINSSVRNGRYAVFSGTSMATPHITGVIALANSLEVMSPGKFEELMKKTAKELGSSVDFKRKEKYGAGLVMAYEICKQLSSSGQLVGGYAR